MPLHLGTLLRVPTGAALLVLSPLLTGGPVWAQTAKPPPDPLRSARSANGVKYRATLRELRLNHRKYAGQVVETEGTVVGRIATGNRTTYLLKGPSMTEYIETEGVFPQMTNGERVRVLVRVPRIRTALHRLTVVAAATAPKPPPPKPKPAATVRSPAPTESRAALPSRGDPRPSVQPVTVAAEEAEPAVATPEPPVTLTPGTSLDQRIARLRPSYAASVKHFNSKLSQAYADWIADLILRFSLQNGIDPRLVVAIVAAESNFRLTATSPKGAMGLGQLMPRTAAGMGVINAYDPSQNLAAAIKIIKGHLDKYRHYGEKQFAMALAAYNAGSGAVKKYGGVPPYRETVSYIWKVYRLYKALAPDMFR